MPRAAEVCELSSMLTNLLAAPCCGDGPAGLNVDDFDVQLSSFFANPLWWPPELASTGKDVEPQPQSEETASAKGRPFKVDQQRLYCLRQLLTKARFEAVDVFMHELDPGKRANTAFAQQALVSPCFAVFTRFNCNLTLVAQRLFDSKLEVNVFDSGRVILEEDAVLHVLKHAAKSALIYRRHVMLSVKDQEHNRMSFVKEPFSYGFLCTFLDALPKKARELVLSETLPFGFILDHCGIRREVEVDRQLHIHIGNEFFSKQSVDAHPESCFTDRVTSPQKPHNAVSSTHDKECLCRLTAEGERCTFGRLTTIRFDGKPAARVVEILNDRLVLFALSLAEREAMLRESHACGSAACGLNDEATEKRVALLAGRCILSVAKCPIHRHLLPKPHVTESQLLARRQPDEGCRLCGSQSCSTDFHAEYTADIV
ncbi:hypothetical protein Esti_000612 [Eimeria stiedai]